MKAVDEDHLIDVREAPPVINTINYLRRGAVKRSLKCVLSMFTAMFDTCAFFRATMFHTFAFFNTFLATLFRAY